MGYSTGPLVNAGLPIGGVLGEWNSDYLDELCLFPGGSFKDQVDASSGAFGRLVMKKTAPTAQSGQQRRN